MTPAKPIRLLCAGADDGVSSLTEMGSTPGSGGQLPRTFRNIGAQLQEAQGGLRLMADPWKVATGLSGAAPSGEEPSAGGDGAETQVAGAPAAIELLRAEHRKWEVVEAVRRAKADAANFGKFEGLSVKLSHLMGVVGDMSAKFAADAKAKEPPAPAPTRDRRMMTTKNLPYSIEESFQN